MKAAGREGDKRPKDIIQYSPAVRKDSSRPPYVRSHTSFLLTWSTPHCHRDSGLGHAESWCQLQEAGKRKTGFFLSQGWYWLVTPTLVYLMSACGGDSRTHSASVLIESAISSDNQRPTFTHLPTSALVLSATAKSSLRDVCT